MSNNYLGARGWLTVGEREMLKYRASQVPDSGTIFNIGIEFGASLHCIRAGNSEASLFAFDLIGDDKLVGDVNAYIMRGDSGEFAKIGNVIIDFIFIDGDHTYSGVMRDIKFLDYLAVGGVVAFHDCYSWDAPKVVHKVCPDVNHAVSNWLGDNQESWKELDYVDSIRVFERVK